LRSSPENSLRQPTTTCGDPIPSSFFDIRVGVFLKFPCFATLVSLSTALASFKTEEAAVTLLYGLVAFGQIIMHKIEGYHQVGRLFEPSHEAAA